VYGVCLKLFMLAFVNEYDSNNNNKHVLMLLADRSGYCGQQPAHVYCTWLHLCLHSV